MRNHIAAVLLLLAFILMGLVACAAPGPDDTGPGDDDVDATPAEDPDGGTSATCSPPATSLPPGNHNAGAACLSCHTGSGAPRWRVAGTLYTSAGGNTPLAGATVTITDANNVVTKLVTASNGNFYSGANFAFPVRVGASRCPDNRAMSAAAPSGDCNSCHTAGGTGRIHLP